jgi:hypothetical protein
LRLQPDYGLIEAIRCARWLDGERQAIFGVKQGDRDIRMFGVAPRGTDPASGDRGACMIHAKAGEGYKLHVIDDIDEQARAARANSWRSCL